MTHRVNDNRPRTLGEAEMLATLIPSNVQGPPERRGLAGFGWPEITFAAGFLAAFVGIALVSVAAALVAGGFGLCALAWKLS
jgi:hypothetical protein